MPRDHFCEPLTEERFHPRQRATLAATDAEFARKNGRCHSRLDVALLRTRKDAFEKHLSPPPETVRRGASDDLAVYRFLFSRAFEQLEAADRASGSGIHPRRRYSTEAKRLGAVYLKLLKRLRRRVNERIPKTAADTRSRMMVGVDLNDRSPLAVFDGLVSQLAACTDPTHVATLQAAGLSPQRWSEELTPAVEKLGREVHGGILGEATTCDIGKAFREALLRLEIVFSRAALWLEDFVSEEAAAAFEADIPRRRKRAKKSAEEGAGSGDEQTDAPCGGSGGSAGNGAQAPNAGSAAGPTPMASAPAPSRPRSPPPAAAASQEVCSARRRPSRDGRPGGSRGRLSRMHARGAPATLAGADEGAHGVVPRGPGE